MDKFKNKYRISSTRLQSWDYSSEGAYFITICTKNREHYFGKIVNNDMQLNDIGDLAEKYWKEIPTHFPIIELGNFVVMPNHIHGILIIDKSTDPNVETLQCNVSTGQCNVAKNTLITAGKNEQMSKISPKPGSISTIVRSYKSVVSKNAHLTQPDFEWQSRFHDHIIRNKESFERIQIYISTNPKNWKDDKFYS